MDPLVKPITLDGLRKITSKMIIDAFLAQPEPEVEIQVSSTKREFQNVYVSLNLYLKRHAELNVELRMQDKRLILSRVKPNEPDGNSPEVH